MTDKDSAFEYTIGGVTFRAVSEICDVHQERALPGSISFYPAYKKEYIISEQDIQLHFSLSRKRYSYENKKKLFFSQSLYLYETAGDCLELFEKKTYEDRVLWSVSIDPEFSSFKYSFYSESAKKIDLRQFAANFFLLQHSFINRQGLIIHSAGGSIQGKGMVFAAPSGTGKSTLTQLLLPSQQNRLFSEERLIIRSVDAAWNVWGTPWSGENNIARNETAPLSALVFLSQSEKTKITELTPSAGLHRLLQVVSIPWYSEEWTNKGLSVCESLIQDIPMFELAFRPDQTAVQAVEELASKL